MSQATHTESVTGTDYNNEYQHPPAQAGYLFTVFAILAAMSVLAIVVGFTDFGEYAGLKVLASLLISSTQATVLALYFMELRHADKVTGLAAAAAIFWTMILFAITLTDYFTRHMGAM